jgi:hypothetical protein
MVPFIVTSYGSLYETLISSLINVTPATQRRIRQAICIIVHDGNAYMLQQWLTTKRLKSLVDLDRLQQQQEEAGQ